MLDLSKHGRVRSHLHHAIGKGNDCSCVLPGFRGFIRKHNSGRCCIHNACANGGISFAGSVFRITGLKFSGLSVRPIVYSPSRPCTLARGRLPTLCERCRVLTRRVLGHNRRNGSFAFCRCVLSLSRNPYVRGHVSNYKSKARCVTIAP